MQSVAAARIQGGKEDLAPVVFCGEGGGVLTRRWSGRPDATALLEFVARHPTHFKTENALVLAELAALSLFSCQQQNDIRGTES